MSHISILMLDIQGSTPLARELGGVDHLRLLTAFDEAVRGKIGAQRGEEFQRQAQRGDDCVKAIFQTPRDAVAAAVDLQNHCKQFGFAQDADGNEIKVTLHLAIHTVPTLPDGSPDISDIPILARVLPHSTDGQILLTQACHDAYLQQHGAIPFVCQPSDERQFKGITGTQRFYNVQYDATYHGEPGTNLIGFRQVEAANLYIPRTETEQAVCAKFQQTVGRSGRCRFVTIHGEGGMGKTRLAVHCAIHLSGDFPGGVVFVPLAFAQPTPASVAGAIYQALEIKEEPQNIGVEESLTFHLLSRPATLLLLDNAEAVTQDATVVHLLKNLLEAIPQLCFLATSRRWVGLGAQEGEVDINAGLTPLESLRLFEARAHHGFQLPVFRPETLDRLSSAVPASGSVQPPSPDGLAEDEYHALFLFYLANHNSLALELIASWTRKYLTIGDLRKNYETRAFNLLTRSGDGLPSGDSLAEQRHRSLEASYLWSWENLGAESNGADARNAFLAASLFADTLTDAAVDAVLDWNDEPRTIHALKTVQDAALLRAVIAHGTTRYRMHWQLQHYGREERFCPPVAETPDNTVALSDLVPRFIAYYQEWSDFHSERITRLTDSRQWLRDEWRNVLAAARDADALGDFHTAVWLRLSLTSHFQLNADWREWEAAGLEAKRSALREIENAGRRRNEGATLNNLGGVYRLQSRWPEAEQAFLADIAICRDLQDRYGEGQTLNNLGGVYRLQSRWPEAEQAYKDSLVIMRDLQDRHGEGQTLNNLGGVYRLQSRWPEAEQAYKDSLVIMRDLQDRHGEGQTLNNLGGVYQLQSRWPEAEQAFLADIAICRDLHDSHGEAQTLCNIVILYLQQGKPQAGGGMAARAVILAKTTTDTALIAQAEQLLLLTQSPRRQAPFAAFLGKIFRRTR